MHPMFSLNYQEAKILAHFTYYGDLVSYSNIYYYNRNLSYNNFISILDSLHKKGLLTKNKFTGYNLAPNRLNLPEANYVVHLDPWWNPAIEQQATDRAYRIGQQKDVTVYHLIAKNTIEEKIRRLHRTKQDLADSLLEGSDIAGQLSIEDILELVRNS